MSSGQGVVPHGGIGLAAASISRSTASPPAAGRATDVFTVLQVQTLAGLIAVPHQTFGGEADHAPAAEIDERDDLRALPLGRDRRLHPEPRGVPRAAPRLARPRTARSRRSRASATLIGSPCT